MQRHNRLAMSYGRWDSAEENAFLAYDSDRLAWAQKNLAADAAVYNDYLQWDVFAATGDPDPGKLSASEIGQAVERICAGYAAAPK